MIQFYIFQVLLSAFIGPSLVYYTLVYWVYPMKDYVGETGCHITFFLRNAGVFAFQLQSLSMAFFRYICLFHSGSVRKLHISLNVSCKDQIMKHLCLCLQLLIRFHCMFDWSFTYWIIVKMHVQLEICTLIQRLQYFLFYLSKIGLGVLYICLSFWQLAHESHD